MANYKVIVAIADEKHKNGYSYSKESLQRIADEDEAFEFDGVNLYHVIKFENCDPEIKKIIDENFWDLV